MEKSTFHVYLMTKSYVKYAMQNLFSREEKSGAQSFYISSYWQPHFKTNVPGNSLHNFQTLFCFLLLADMVKYGIPWLKKYVNIFNT